MANYLDNQGNQVTLSPDLMADSASITKQGLLKKRSARIHSWNTRYFMLTGPKLSYKLKEESSHIRDTFDLAPGCIVTEIQEESKGSGKKLFSFWIIWPEENKDNKNHKFEEKVQITSTASLDGYYSDDDNDNDDESIRNRGRNLKQIVESEVQSHRKNKSSAEGIVEQYHARDQSYSLGVKVAAVAVGGVLVGALTAGIGLVPYITVVGITAAAGGGAVALHWRKPLDSRLILACETMEDAIEWKIAVTQQIMKLVDTLKPAVPACIDANKFSSLINLKISDQAWYTVSFREGLRILEHVTTPVVFRRTFLVQATSWLRVLREFWWKKPVNFMFPVHLVEHNANVLNAVVPECVLQSNEGGGAVAGSVYCRRSNGVAPCLPTNCFLFLMNARAWPKFGDLRIVKEIDDHADIIGVELRYDDDYYAAVYPGAKRRKDRLVARRLALSRFWSLDEEGVYIITMNSLYCEEYPPAIKVSLFLSLL